MVPALSVQTVSASILLREWMSSWASALGPAGWPDADSGLACCPRRAPEEQSLSAAAAESLPVSRYARARPESDRVARRLAWAVRPPLLAGVTPAATAGAMPAAAAEARGSCCRHPAVRSSVPERHSERAPAASSVARREER